MPGLLRGLARTAAVAGTATAVSNRVSRRQAGRWAQQAPAPEPEPQPEEETAAPVAPSSTDDRLEQLRQLGELKTSGVLTDEEFTEQKRRILDS
jgi:putative oligomerization/nucleic acid binding protein